MRQKLGRAAISVLLGFTLSVAYNASVFFLLGIVDPYMQGSMAHVFLAPGILLAGPGFEAQMAIMPLNAIVFFCAFTAVSWMILSRRARLKENTTPRYPA